ncbi:MAG TPA: serine/threonine-protein kinase [Nitrospirota bacterium]|nr:serine/threonine-protein kinase [Nitrospirota bacterium]
MHMKRLLKKRYEVLDILGKGGMGCVYKVADLYQGRRVLAVKELREGALPLGKVMETVMQFRTEARMLARLTHPNLPKVYDYFSRSKAHYIVMEYVHGKTLNQILASRAGDPLEEDIALSWALQICRTMHFLSVQKPHPIIFRDLKPSNIMIGNDGRVKLIDFGIARFFKVDKREDTFVYGTPGYAAPEQYGSCQTDVRSDIFSLGATLHHCLTGKNPSENPLNFPDPRKLNPLISKETALIINKAVALNMEKRFQSAQEMKQMIQETLLASGERLKGRQRIIRALAGKPIKLPWMQKTSWVSLPMMALGCGGTVGTLTTNDHWIQPKPRSFSADTLQLLFRVETRKLKFGKEYRPRIIIHTDAGILRPQLIFKKTWPWIILEAAVLATAIVLTILAR